MSFNFIPIASDSLSGTDQNPLNPSAWVTLQGESPLQILNRQCVATDSGSGCVEYYKNSVSWSNNQYAQIQLQYLDPAAAIAMFLRSDGGVNNCYEFDILGGLGAGNGEISCECPVTSALIFDITGLTFSTGDIIRAAVVGETCYAWQNGVLVGLGNDPSISSGVIAIAIADVGTPVASTSFTNFQGGGVQVVTTLSELPTCLIRDMLFLNPSASSFPLSVNQGNGTFSNTVSRAALQAEYNSRLPLTDPNTIFGETFPAIM